jgi:hypothetical protein
MREAEALAVSVTFTVIAENVEPLAFHVWVRLNAGAEVVRVPELIDCPTENALSWLSRATRELSLARGSVPVVRSAADPLVATAESPVI